MDISVVVPAYNAARTVAETLESIVAQTLPPREIIVVDDGSRDDTLDVLSRYAGQVTVFSQDNSGVSATRNRGVREASSEWVAFCDADDVWHPLKLQVLSAVATDQINAELIFHDFWVIVGETVTETRATHSPRHSLFPLFKDRLTTMPCILPDHRVVRLVDLSSSFDEVTTWSGNPFRWLLVGNIVQPSTVAMRRSTFLNLGGFDHEFRYAEDTEFFLRIAKSVRFSWMDVSLAGYRRAAGTLLTGNMLPTITNGLRAVVKHGVDDSAVYQVHRRWVNRAVAQRAARVGYYYLSELRQDSARHFCRTALTYRPLHPLAWTVLAGTLVPPSCLRLARHAKAVVRRLLHRR